MSSTIFISQGVGGDVGVCVCACEGVRGVCENACVPASLGIKIDIRAKSKK